MYFFNRLSLFILFIIIGIFLRIDNSINVLEYENRQASLRPSLLIYNKESSLALNNSFGKKFDDWFLDHVYYRKQFITFFHKMNYVLSNDFSNSDLLMGTDNWFFTKEDNNLQLLQRTLNINHNFTNSIIDPIIKLSEYCKINNKLFIILITPTKAKVYGDFLPSHITINPQGIDFVDHINEILSNHHNMNVIYPLNNLIDYKKNGELLYWKNDVHWTPLGAYYGYKEILDSIATKKMNIPVYQLNHLNSPTQHRIGDLNYYNLAIPPDESTLYRYPQINTFTPEFQNHREYEDLTTLLYKNKYGHKKMFAFGDSMITFLEPYLAYSFEHLTIVKETHYLKNEYKKLFDESDIILMQIQDRILQFPITFENGFLQ